MWRNNMHLNRHYACELFTAGWTPSEIAAVWGRIWKCTNGKLGSRVSENTPLTMAGVAEAIKWRNDGLSVEDINARLGRW